jgi:hypothetical protein
METGISFGINELIISVVFALVLVVAFSGTSKKKNQSRDEDQ